MLIVISPAKTLDLEPQSLIDDHSTPDFLDQAGKLNKELRKLKAADLCKLQSISEKLGQLNFERNSQWKPPFTTENAKQALLTFKGDVYLGLQADQFTKRDFKFAQDHLRILSGLYGVLRPLDLIQPYRLEMGTSLKVGRADNLYKFWGTRITDRLNDVMAKQRPGVLVNLASQEYFNAVDEKSVNGRVVVPVFKDEKNGKYKVISFFAKKARGLMASWILRNRIKKAEDLMDFDVDGYAFDASMSSEDEFVFTRPEPKS